VNSRRGYRELDDSPKIVGDKGFTGFMSSIKPSSLPEGILYDSVNSRIENGEIETRKGSDVKYHDENFRDAHSAVRYVNPILAAENSAAIAIAHNQSATIYDPKEEIIEVPYQSGQEAKGDAELVEAFGSLFMTRGAGAKLPCMLPAKLGEYPLEYDGKPVYEDDVQVGDLIYVKHSHWGLYNFDLDEPWKREWVWIESSNTATPKLLEVVEIIGKDRSVRVTNPRGYRRFTTGEEPNEVFEEKYMDTLWLGFWEKNISWFKANPVAGQFKMPGASLIIQIYPWSRTADSDDVRKGRADAVGETINECRVDLAPIESYYDEFFFNSDGVLNGSALGANTGHNFKDGDTIKITGTQSYDGTFTVKRHDFNTIVLEKAPIPSTNIEQNTQAIAWNESSYLRPSDFAITTANRLAFKAATDLVQFSDVFAPSTVNPFFNRVLVNEGTGDQIVSMLPVQDDSLLVFKRNSIYLITATSTLGENLRVIEITRQLGCASRGSVQEIGNIVYFLSDNGIYAVDSGIRNESNIASPIKALEIIDKPISHVIQDKIDDIDFRYSDKFISAYVNNRYYLGVVTNLSADGKINRIYVYNQLTQKFESIDEVPDDMYPKEFVVIPLEGKNRLHIVTKDSQVIAYEISDVGTDSYFDEEGQWKETNILFAITTRQYDAETFNLKRWHKIGLAAQSLDSETSLSLGFNTMNPDSASLVFAEKLQDQYRKTLRVIARKRAQNLSLTISNMTDKSNRKGRMRISEIFAEGSECARSSRNYSDIKTQAPSRYSILSGTRPNLDNYSSIPLVGDPSVQNRVQVNTGIINVGVTRGDEYHGLAITGSPDDGHISFIKDGVRMWIALSAEGTLFQYTAMDGIPIFDEVTKEVTTTELGCPGGYKLEDTGFGMVCQYQGTGIYLPLEPQYGIGGVNEGTGVETQAVCPTGFEPVVNHLGKTKCHPIPEEITTTKLVTTSEARTVSKLWEDVLAEMPEGHQYHRIEGMIRILETGDHAQSYLIKTAAPWNFN
jgi:hypothetical protein